MTAGAADFARLPAAGLGPLADRLVRARRRALSVRLVDGALSAVAIAFAAFLTWPILLPPHDEVAAPDPVVSAIVIGAALFLVAAAASFFRRAPIDAFARAADREFALGERTSTAVEVAASGGMTPMALALMADTMARAAVVEPRRLAPFMQPGRIAAIIALAVFAAVLALAPRSAPARPETAAPAVGDFVLSEEAREDAAAEIRRAADLIGQDAERRSNPYLQAVARELTRLGEAIENGDANGAELRAELERLQQFAADGYQRAGETPGSSGDLSRAISGALDSLDRSAAAANPERRDAGNPSVPGEPQSPGLAAGGTGDAPQAPAPENPSGIPAKEETISSKGSGGFAARPQGAPTEGADVKSEICDGETDASCFNVMPRVEVESIVGDARGIELAGGAPDAGDAPPKLDNGVLLGPAPKSGAGESYEAGRGSEAIGGGQAADPTAYASGAEISIDNQRFATGGNRIRVDAVPQPGSQPLPSGGQGGQENWRALPETDIGRVLLPPQGRDVVARYFTR